MSFERFKLGRSVRTLGVTLFVAILAIAIKTGNSSLASKRDGVAPVTFGQNQARTVQTNGVSAAFKKRVLILSIDGLRQADLTDPVLTAYLPNITMLASQGVVYGNATTAVPSDAFPGLLGIVTGAGPKTTGVYYDVTYSRALLPPGGGNQPAGTVVRYDSTINTGYNPGTRVSPLFTTLDSTKLPVDPITQVTPIFPHNYLKVNTIFEIAQTAGFRTAWCDKHASYEILGGPSGLGVVDLYTPDIDAKIVVNPDGSVSDAPQIGVSPTQDLNAALAYDDLSLKAVLNQIAGKTSTGGTVANNTVPGIFGASFVAASSFQKQVGLNGGIDLLNNAEVPSANLVQALQHTDVSVGKLITALKAANLYETTMIVVTARHGQSPRIGSATGVPAGTYTTLLASLGTPIPVKQSTENGVSLLWLKNQSQTDAAVTALLNARNTISNGIDNIYARTNVVDPNVLQLGQNGFGDPSSLNDDRTPDIIVQTLPGYLIGDTNVERAERGGFSSDETHVALIVAGGIPTIVRGSTQTAAVNNKQIAPLALQYLGLNLSLLQGGVAESTLALPGVLDVPAYFTSSASANPPISTVGTLVAFNAVASSPTNLPLTYIWNFNDPVNTAPATGTNPTHTFTLPGTYTATVTVTDGVNLPIVSIAKVTVNPLPGAPSSLTNLKNIIVIYQEGWSFDSLYGSFPNANGIANARAALTLRPQVNVYAGNAPLAQSPAVPLNGGVADPRFTSFDAVGALKPYNALPFIPTTSTSGSLVSRFLTEQVQIDGGKMDKFVSLSDNPGLVMSNFDATNLPEGQLAQQYVLCDNFFHAAFGGSFLNHHWLIAAQTPIDANAPSALYQPVTANQVNGNFGLDFNLNPTPTKSGTGATSTVDNAVSTDNYAVNTLYSVNTPHPSNVATSNLVSNQTNATIGDRLNDSGISWTWYSGGYAAAISGQADATFQCDHQPFIYYQNYADGTANKAAHLKDETKFLSDLQNGTLTSVAFIKPLGSNDERPGYATLQDGQQHVASLVAAVQASPYWQNCAIVIAYADNGGRYDHVAPPSAAGGSPAGTYDRFGPGARVPAIVISPYAKKGFVDHTAYDTTSILRLIEKRWSLAPLGSRDAAVNSLDNAFNFQQPPVVSVPVAAPSKSGVGQTVSFLATATSPTGAPLTVAWNFGDPTNTATATTLAASHVFNKAGTYTVTLTVSDVLNPPVVQTVQVTVLMPVFGSGSDSDGDGFSDAFETLFGSNPYDATSTPLGGSVAPVPVPATLSGTKVKLNFNIKMPSTDSISFKGVLPVPANFVYTGQNFSVDFGGVMRVIPLFNAGVSAKGDNALIFGKPKNGNAAFKLVIKNASLAGVLANDGLTNESFGRKPVSIPVNILFNGAVYTETLNLSYKSVKGGTGTAQ